MTREWLFRHKYSVHNPPTLIPFNTSFSCAGFIFIAWTMSVSNFPLLPASDQGCSQLYRLLRDISYSPYLFLSIVLHLRCVWQASTWTLEDPCNVREKHDQWMLQTARCTLRMLSACNVCMCHVRVFAWLAACHRHLYHHYVTMSSTRPLYVSSPPMRTRGYIRRKRAKWRLHVGGRDLNFTLALFIIFIVYLPMSPS